jgi:hypothetical protein
MTYLASHQALNAGISLAPFEPKQNSRRNSRKEIFIAFIQSVVGAPDYSFTLTLKPVVGPRRLSTKVNDAEQAMDWFLHVLNTKCFGHGYRRKAAELGFFATLEGLGIGKQPHWHGAIRLPTAFPRDKFLLAFENAKNRTKRFGHQSHLEPYYEGSWMKYITKSGVESVHPQFLRRGTP